MSVGSVAGSAGPRFAQLELEGDFTSVAGRLAALVLENELTHQQIDRDSLASARERHNHALAREVSALREQADDARLGAVVTGSLGIASAGLDVWASTLDCAPGGEPQPASTRAVLWQKPAADGLANIAQPLGNYVSHNYGAAEATSAQSEREQASWEMEDLRKNIHDADETQDEALEWVSGLVDRDAAATSAILSNKV